MAFAILAIVHFAFALLAMINGHEPYDALQLGMLFLIASRVFN
jgi:hypothetical protein